MRGRSCIYWPVFGARSWTEANLARGQHSQKPYFMEGKGGSEEACHLPELMPQVGGAGLELRLPGPEQWPLGEKPGHVLLWALARGSAPWPGARSLPRRSLAECLQMTCWQTRAAWGSPCQQTV